ncbi:MAG: hypothetical protein FJX70_07405 [Alphaproteobacteria bacterium]|nr:hypothetical protein [Alphaproteobacteria bacterium]
MQHALQNLGQDVSEQLGKLYSFQKEKALYRKSYIEWDKIKRANRKIKPIRQKSFFLSSPANKLLSAVIGKLRQGERVFLNHKYISTFTLVERRQNQNIIKELADILDITYHNSVTHNNKKYRYSYEFGYKQKNLENNTCVENSIERKISRQNDPLYIYKENKDIEDIDLESNFLQNSKEVKTAPIETVKFKKRVPNERKKPTNAEHKARIYRFNQYKEPQDLKRHYPLTKEDGDKLQILSGRDFSLNAMNEILLDMSKRKDNRFCSKAQFMAYFGKCLRFEMRDAVKTGNDNFRIKANIIDEEAPKKPKIFVENELKAYDLENRTTEGFQRLSAFGILDKLKFENSSNN